MNVKLQTAELKCRNATRTLPHRAGCLIPFLLALWLIVPGYIGGQNSTTVGAIEGAAFIVDSSGPSYVPGAGVVLSGSRTLQTGRLPDSVEWIAVSDDAATLPMLVGEAAANADRISFIMADRAYHPSLHKMISEWDGNGGALKLTTEGKPIGLAVVSRQLALERKRLGNTPFRRQGCVVKWLDE